MAKINLAFLALAIALSLSACRRSQEIKSISVSSNDQNPNSNPSLTPKNSEPLIWAGLSGLTPKFIDSGPNRGTGWVEYQTLGIRKALSEEGFGVEVQYMTPARIAHELRKKSPICFYPVEWKDPKNTILSANDRIYSVPLDLGGETSRKIIFNKLDLPRFKKHIDPKGDLLLDSLLKDQSLKTLLVRDRDYGALNDQLLEINSQGDQIVKKEYEKNVSLRVTRDNLQILEMLNARRFDYTFSDSIDPSEFARAKLDASSFLQLRFSAASVWSVDAPNLVLVSAVCSRHPLSIQAMPYVNEAIIQARGQDWVKRVANYRNKTSPYLPLDQDGLDVFFNSTVYRFKGELAANKTERWYTQQIAKVPGLKLLPDRSASKAGELPDVKAHTPKWHIVKPTPNSLMILNDAFPGITDRLWTHANRFLFAPYEFSKSYFRANEQNIIENRLFLNDSQSIPHFRELPLRDGAKFERLILAARGLTVSDLQILKPIFSSGSLKEVMILGAGESAARFLVSILPQQLTLLNMTSSSLTDSGIETQIRKMPLKALHLSNSQLTPLQLRLLLQNINPKIEELSLGWQRRAWNLSNVDTFNTQHFDHLKYLDLEMCHLFESHVISLAKGLSSHLKVLHLGSNFLTPQAAQTLLLKPFPNLVDLDLSGAVQGDGWSFVFSSNGGTPLQFPPNLKRLGLARTHLTPATLSRVRWPKSLSSLDLSRNPLGDVSLDSLISHFDAQMENLSLDATHIGNKFFNELVKNGKIRRIRDLSLNNNDLDNDSLTLLSKANLELTKLALDGNRITDSGAKIIAKNWMPRLQSFSIAENLIDAPGIAYLADSFGPELRSLNLASNRGVNAQSLAEKIPPKLQTLDLSDLQLSDREISILAPSLPRDLKELKLSGSIFRLAGTKSLATHLPRSLLVLAVGNLGLDEGGHRLLASALPGSLNTLLWGSGVLNQEEALAFAKGLPKGLIDLDLEKISFTHLESFQGVLTSIPSSLTQLRMSGIKVASTGGSEWKMEWPSNLRSLELWGVDFGLRGRLSWLEGLPAALENLEFHDFTLGEKGGRILLKQNFPNSNFVSFRSSGITGAMGMQLLHHFHGTPGLELAGLIQTQDSDLLKLQKQDLSGTIDIGLDNARYSNKAVEYFLSLLDPNTDYIALASLRLTVSGVDALIRQLPPRLRNLSIVGNPIGEKGIAKFRAYQREREAQEGLPFVLEE